MAAKSDKKGSAPKKNGLQKDGETNKKLTNSENQDKEEDNIDFENDVKSAKAPKKSTSAIKESDEKDIDFDEDETGADDAKEVEDDWDPDFDEFDLPKSSKKILPGKKSVKESEDEFKVDEEFEDFFNSSPKKKYDDEDEDY